MLTADEQAAGRSLAAEEAKQRASTQPAPASLRSFLPAQPKNKKTLYAALAATALVIVAALLYPDAFGRLFRYEAPPESTATRPPLNIDVNSANAGKQTDQASSSGKKPGQVGEPDEVVPQPTPEGDSSHVTLPPIKTASDE